MAGEAVCAGAEVENGEILHLRSPSCKEFMASWIPDRGRRKESYQGAGGKCCLLSSPK